MQSVRTSFELWLKYKDTNSQRLRDRISQENDGLARKVARRFVGQCQDDFEDLHQIARIGLLKAIEKFDPTKGVAFSSFAIPYIRGEIQHYLRDRFGAVKIPRRAFESVGKVKKAKRQMERLGREVSLEEAAKGIGLSKEKWTWLSDAVQRKQLAALDEVLEPVAEADDERLQLRKRVLVAMARLTTLERLTVESSYFWEQNVSAIAKRQKRTPEEVQATLDSALVKFKSILGELHG